jgi:hypothetical protein
MELLCGGVFVVLFITVIGHGLWVIASSVLKGLAGTEPNLPRPFRHCPACGEEVYENLERCPRCALVLDGRTAYDLHRVRVAQREIRALIDDARIDRNSAEPILEQLETRARALRGLPPVKRAPPRAKPVVPEPHPEPEPLAPPYAGAPGPIAEGGSVLPAGLPEPTPESGTEAAGSPPLFSPAGAAANAPAHSAPALTPDLEPLPPPVPLEPAAPAAPSVPPPPPKRRMSHFLEEHNILWGELVGGLLIVGCSIALVVTLRQTLEALPYFQFMLSAAVTLGLFGAGQYTLHRWKLAGTSRGMLVISMLLTPLTLLLLSEPFTPGAAGPLDVVVKTAALVAFVGVVRTSGRDLIGTEHLPGPIDRRWLLALAVVGAAGTQLLPPVSAWLPLLCFVVACAATLGGLSWYHPGRRSEPISDKSGSALLMFVGVAGFALLAAWGLYLKRASATDTVPNVLALPLVLAGVPVVEAGVLVLRRTGSAGLRTAGTATALVGFFAMTLGLALAWPDPLMVLLVAAATGAFLTRSVHPKAARCWPASRCCSGSSPKCSRDTPRTKRGATLSARSSPVRPLSCSSAGTASNTPLLPRVHTLHSRWACWRATRGGCSAHSLRPVCGSPSPGRCGRSGGLPRGNRPCGASSSRWKRVFSRPVRWRSAAPAAEQPPCSAARDATCRSQRARWPWSSP